MHFHFALCPEKYISGPGNRAGADRQVAEGGGAITEGVLGGYYVEARGGWATA